MLTWLLAADADAGESEDEDEVYLGGGEGLVA
jgi:hypothetical protein